MTKEKKEYEASVSKYQKLNETAHQMEIGSSSSSNISTAASDKILSTSIDTDLQNTDTISEVLIDSDQCSSDSDRVSSDLDEFSDSAEDILPT